MDRDELIEVAHDAIRHADDSPLKRICEDLVDMLDPREGKYPLKCIELGHEFKPQMLLGDMRPAPCGCFWGSEPACRAWMVIDPFCKHPSNPFDKRDYAEAQAWLAHCISSHAHDLCPEMPHDFGLRIVSEMEWLFPRIIGMVGGEFYKTRIDG